MARHEDHPALPHEHQVPADREAAFDRALSDAARRTQDPAVRRWFEQLLAGDGGQQPTTNAPGV